MMKQLLKQIGFACTFIGTTIPYTHAVENGNVQYGLGSAQFFAGAIPPIPGLFLNNQLNYYTADRTNDSNGDKQNVDFDSDIVINTFRMLYVTDKEMLQGKVWYQAVLPVMVSQDVTVTSRFVNQDINHHGLLDPSVTAGLRWGKGLHTYVFGMEAGLPLGTESTSENHWSLQPTIGYHYIDFRNPDWEFGFTTRYIMNTKNTKNDYRSGQSLVTDYAAGYYFGKLRVGVTGYWMRQTTDDSGANGANRTNAFAIGPSIKWMFKDDSILSGSVQKEVYTENRSQGISTWINYALKY